MTKVILFFIIFTISMATIAGLPPTSTKGSGDASFITTFKFDFSDIPLTHTGTTATVGTIPVSKGGTGSTSLTANNVILGNGTSAVQFVAPGTLGNVLKSNGTTWVSDTATFGTDVVTTAGATNPVVHSCRVTYSGGVPSADTTNGLCGLWVSSITDNAAGDSTLNLGSVFSSAPHCTVMVELVGRQCRRVTVTSSSIRIICDNNSGASEDNNYTLICHGVAP